MRRERLFATLLTQSAHAGDTAVMGHFFIVLFTTIGRWFRCNQAWAVICLTSLLCACSVGGGASMLPPMHIPQDRVHEVCWEPPDPQGHEDTVDTTDTGDVGKFFIFVNNKDIVYSKNRWAFAGAIREGGLIYKYVESAPIENLRLIPVSRTDAWCTRIPKPTDEEVLRWLTPSTEPTATVQSSPAAKNLFGQVESLPIRSGLFCGKSPRMAPTTADTISLFQRNIAYQQSYQYAHETARALTQAEADLKRVTEESKWSLKRLFLEDPGSLEQVQLRVAAELDTIEAPPEYDDPELECLSSLGFNIGFDNGKFEVEAKLFAIDVGVMLVEFAAMEVALGPLGGAKFLASAVSKGTKAMTAAVSRLKDIPIFLPLANGGIGGAVKIGNVLKSLSQYHSRRLERAMFDEADKLFKAGKLKERLVKAVTEETHHIVAHTSNRKFAIKCREVLDKFGIDLDHAANGVFLPATKKSPNPKGSIVHKILGNNDAYYETMHKYLNDATSPADVLQRLRRIGEALEKGTFFNAPL